MRMGQQVYLVGDRTDSGVLQKSEQSDQDGFKMDLHNIFLDKGHLKWGKYQSPKPKSYTVVPLVDSVVSHFCLSGSCLTEDHQKLNMNQGQFVVFKEQRQEYHHEVFTDAKGKGAFFEISIAMEYFESWFGTEVSFLDAIDLQKKAFINPKMLSLLAELVGCNEYKGALRKLYLESKMVELLLLQSQLLQAEKTDGTFKLYPGDREALFFIKDHLDIHFMENCSILSLAQMAGINQTKLKCGFKALFGETVFGYITGLRMKAAKQLLLESPLQIGEIAFFSGYKHTQHFTAAFKKYFGYLPGSLRR
eukprot:gene14666-17343_t